MRQPVMGIRRVAVCAAIGLLLAASSAPAAAGTTPFTDIGGSAFVMEIEWLFHSGITGGCAADKFCPTAPVTRGQMASFLARALKLAAPAGDHFTDDETSIHEDDINRLAESGITSGCAADLYCPTANVTRAQMASFLVRGFALPAPQPPTYDPFTDDEGNIHEADINRLAYSGITTGCTATTYCPGNSVTREQMAAFLYRAFHNPNPCDQDLASGDLDPLNSAKALGLCAREGLTSAAWTLPDGEDMPVKPANYDVGHSIRPDFGTVIAPQEGARLIVLSTGHAADLNDANPPYQEVTDKGYSHPLPDGFPLSQQHTQSGTPCPDLTTNTRDGVALRLAVKAPPGATAFAIDWKYYSLDYPEWVCGPYVDAAAVLVDGDNVLEIDGHTVTANSAMEACDSGGAGFGSGSTAVSHICPNGSAELAGTGFYLPKGPPPRNYGGASAWRTTTVPVVPHTTYTVVLTIWDSHDGAIKSTVLFDNFRWVE